MDPRTHSRGAAPDFSMAGLSANPNPKRITDALWWLRCMRLRLEPLSADGGILAIKPGYHSYGGRLPGAGASGQGKATTDHSIRRAPDRTGPWWEDFASAHDWTFNRAHTGNYTEINLYVGRLVRSMRDLADPRPDDVYAYTIGQLDGDREVEGWNEYRDEPETGDDSHLWHRHDSFRRNIVGSFPHMWRALTIDMGWTYAEWQQSVNPEDDMATVDETVRALLNADLGKPGGGDSVAVALQDGLINGRRALTELSALRSAASVAAARDVEVAAILAGMRTALDALVASNGALTPEQVAALAEVVQEAARMAGTEAVSALTGRLDSLRAHLGDDGTA